MPTVNSIKDAIDYLASQAKERGGVVQAAPMPLGVPLKVGDAVMLIRAHGNHAEPLIQPEALSVNLGFGEYVIGYFILSTKETAPAPETAPI